MNKSLRGVGMEKIVKFSLELLFDKQA